MRGAQPFGEPVDAVVRRHHPVLARCAQVLGRIGSEEELAQELVLPRAELQRDGHAVATDDGVRRP